MFNSERIEKYILRQSFQEDNYLPQEVLWRKKEAFSDGVSSNDKSWYQIIQEHVNDIISDIDYELLKENYTFNKPYSKESLYYRQIFEKYYPNAEHTIPYFWTQPFSTQLEPSARTLSIYNIENNINIIQNTIQNTLDSIIEKIISTSN